jgi:hypothetical protein
MTIKAFAVYPDGRREEIGPDEDGFYRAPNDALFIEYRQSGYYDFNAWQSGQNFIIGRLSDEDS